MMGAVTPETCTVTLQKINVCILLHQGGPFINTEDKQINHIIVNGIFRSHGDHGSNGNDRNINTGKPGN